MDGEDRSICPVRKKSRRRCHVGLPAESWFNRSRYGRLLQDRVGASACLPVKRLACSIGVKGALEVVRILLDEAPNVVGLKEDYGPEFIRPACLLAREKWAIFAGGQKQTHMDMVPYGVDGYMSIFMTFKPEISQRYWAAVESNNLSAGATIIRDYDMPTIDFLYTQFTAGGDAGQHGMLELAGICQRWRRKPLSDLSDEEMEKLRSFFQERGLL